VEATSAAVKLAIEKLLFLRGMDAHLLDLLPAADRPMPPRPATAGTPKG
jgi:hypothetical protein